MGHAVTIIGYSNRMQAFLIRNTWGTRWNGTGHVWFPYKNFPIQWETWTLFPRGTENLLYHKRRAEPQYAFAGAPLKALEDLSSESSKSALLSAMSKDGLTKEQQKKLAGMLMPALLSLTKKSEAAKSGKEKKKAGDKSRKPCKKRAKRPEDKASRKVDRGSTKEDKIIVKSFDDEDKSVGKRWSKGQKDAKKDAKIKVTKLDDPSDDKYTFVPDDKSDCKSHKSYSSSLSTSCQDKVKIF